MVAIELEWLAIFNTSTTMLIAKFSVNAKIGRQSSNPIDNGVDDGSMTQLTNGSRNFHTTGVTKTMGVLSRGEKGVPSSKAFVLRNTY